MMVKHSFLTLVGVCYFFTLVAQIPQPRAKGEWYLQSAWGALRSDRYYPHEGEAQLTHRYMQSAWNLHGEYGVSDRLALICSVPALKRQSFDDTDATIGMGDGRIEARYTFRGAAALRLGLAVEIPLSPDAQYAISDSLNQYGLKDQYYLTASDTEWNAWLTVSSFRRFGEKGYAHAYAAYNQRWIDFTPQWKVGIDGGILIGRRLWIIGHMAALESFGGPGFIRTGLPFTQGEGVGYTSAGGGLRYRINDAWSVLADATTYTDWLRPRKNIYSGPFWRFGVSYEYR